MQITKYLDTIEEMTDRLQDMMELRGEQEQAEEKRQNIQKLQLEVASKYGKKFERIKKLWKRQVTQEEIDALYASVFDERLLTKIKRLFGLREKQMDEYNSLMDRLDFLESWYVSQKEDCEAQIGTNSRQLQQFLENYKKEYEKVVEEYGGQVDAGWEKFSLPEENGKQIYLGDMWLEITDDPDVEKNVMRFLGNAAAGSSVLAPFLVSAEASFKIAVVYHNEKERQAASSLMRSVIFQMLRHMPLYSYQFTCVDRRSSGSQFGELMALEQFVETEAEGSHLEVFGARYQMLKLASTEAMIHERMTELEQYVDAVSKLLGGVHSVQEYNEKHSDRIPWRVLLIDGFPEGMGDKDLKTLSKILYNAERCGISLICTMSCTGEETYQALLKEAGIARKEQYRIVCGGEEEELISQGIRGPFHINGMRTRRQEYVNSILEHLDMSKKVDNRFEAVFDLEKPFGQMDSTEYISIPFSIDRRGNVSNLCLGSRSEYAFGLLSGSAGSGKSTLLHMIINSILMNYTPEDVQLWLVDYNFVEFSTYLYQTPPNVKFLGLSRSEEFTFAFIDYMYNEYLRRARLMKKIQEENPQDIQLSGIANITQYKRQFGKDSLARIVIVIDEFHVMTNQIQGTEYAIKLEEFLKEARKFGMTCLFSDQTVSVGLRGLTQAGREQIRVRMAMANDDPAEIRETLAIAGNSHQVIRTMDTGEVTVRRFKKVKDTERNEVLQPVYDVEKVILISEQYRRWVSEKASESYHAGNRPLIVDGEKRSFIDWKQVETYEEENDREPDKIWLHLGKPTNLDPLFCIRLLRNNGQNLMCVGYQNNLQASVLFHTAESVLRQPDAELYIFADENDDIYQAYRREWKEYARKNDRIRLITDYEEMCTIILELTEELEKRRRRKGKNVVVLWMGLDSILEEMTYYASGRPKKETEKKAKKTKEKADDIEKAMDDMDALFAELFSDSDDKKSDLEKRSHQKEEKETNVWRKKTDGIWDGAETGDREDESEDDGNLYNATEDISLLFERGPKRGIFHGIFTSSVFITKKYREIRWDEYFKLRIGFRMDSDSSLDYFGRSKLMETVSEEMAVFWDKGPQVHNFLPYVWEKEKNRRK